MKVGIVSTFPPEKCGIGVSAEKHYSELSKKEDIDVVKISPSKSNDFYVNFHNPIFYRRINKLVESENIDIIHAHHEFGLYRLDGLNLSLIDAPTIVNIHEPKHEMPFSWYSIRSRFSSFARDRIISKSNKIVVHTSNDKKKLENSFNNVEHIPLGLDPNSENNSNSMNQVLFFGFLRPSKNIESIVQAADEVDQNIIIAGSARNESNKQYEEKIKDMSKKRDNVEVRIKWINDSEKEKLFEESDAAILPYSKQDSGSMVLNEAISHNLPVITSKQPIFQQKVKKNDIGITVKPTSSKISDALTRMDKNYEEYKQNIVRYENHTTWDDVTNRYIELYNQLLDS